MLNLRNAILSRVRIGVYSKWSSDREYLYGMCRHANLLRTCSTATGTDQVQVINRVIGLVKKFDKIDAAKVISNALFLVLLLFSSED